MRRPRLSFPHWLAALCLAAGASAESLRLVENHTAKATIVVQAAAPAPIRQAAADLQNYIEKLTGVRLPLHADGKRVAGPTLNIGRTDASRDEDFPDSSLNPESFSLTVRDGDIYFAGHHPSPTAFAVYSFLEEQLGIRWFAPGAEWDYVPRTTEGLAGDLTVQVESKTSVPGTSPRIWSGHHWTDDWKLWCLRNRAVQSEKVPRRNFQNQMHTVFPPSKYATTHPEYYPLVHGKRLLPKGDNERDWWPCMGNPEVRALTVEFIRNHFDKHPESDSFSLGMDDIYRICGCPLCLAMDARPDDHENSRFSSRYYKFVNLIAHEVKKTHPDRFLGALIYQFTVAPPEDVPLMEDNVFGYLADGSIAQWYQPGKKEEWMERTRTWRKKISHLSRYDYYGLGTFVPRVFPQAIDEALKFDKQLGLEGMYVEVYTFLPHTAPMIWALAKLQWEPQLKIDALLDEFYRGMFPATHADMRAYYDLMERSWNTPRPYHVGWVHRNILHQAASVAPEAVSEGLRRLQAAAERAQDEVEKHRIHAVLGGLEFAKYAVYELGLAQRLAESRIANAREADAAAELTRKLGELARKRREEWPRAMERQDLLGANIRALATPRNIHRDAYLQSDFAKLEQPAVPVIGTLLEWMRRQKPRAAEALVAEIRRDFETGPIRALAEADHWLETSRKRGRESLVTNGDFEQTRKLGPAAAGTWEGASAPLQWNPWSRQGKARFGMSRGPKVSEKAVTVQARQPQEVGTLMQTLPVTPGKRYLAIAWTKADSRELAEQVTLSLRYQDDKGWLKGDKRRTQVAAGASAEWQRLLLIDTPPEGATKAVLMAGAHGTGAHFARIACYELDETDGGDL